MRTLEKWIDSWSSGICCIILIGVTAFLGWRFVYLQADLVHNRVGFAGLVVGLIILSFLFSSVEAAFSVSAGDQGISDKINSELADITQKWSALAKKGVDDINALSAAERRQRNSLERKSTRISEIRRVLVVDNGRRVDRIGALSALGVIVNTALAAFLSIFVASTQSIALQVGPLELGYDKVLIWVASSLPIIYLGKVVPKTVGHEFPVRFAYKFYAVGGAAFILTGWMPKGLRWLLKLFGILK